MSVDSLTSKLAHNPLTNLGDRIGNLFKTKPQTIEDVPVRSTSPAEEVYLGNVSVINEIIIFFLKEIK